MIISPFPTQQRIRVRHAFSLVEVVLAVAIMAVGVVTLMGLLPHGIEVSGKTANELAVTRIVQQVVGEMQVSNWDQLDAGAGTPIRKFYDDQGIEIDRSANNFEYALSYVAEVQLPPTNGVLAARLPVNGSSAAEQANLRRVVIRIVERPIEDFNFEAAPVGTFRTITQLVARMR